MPAASAVILPFPGRRHPAEASDFVLLPEHLAAAPAGRGRPHGPERLALRLPDLAPNLLLAAPFLLSPTGGGARDLVAAAMAVLLFTLLGQAAPLLARLFARDRRRGASLPELAAGLTVAVAFLGSLALGHGLALLLLLFGALEVTRHAPGSGGRLALMLTATAVLLRLDAGAALLGQTLPPTMAAAGLLFGLFLALRPAARTGRTVNLWRELLVLLLAALVASLYAATLLAAPSAPHRLTLLSVPPLLLLLVRLWQLGSTGAETATRDPWLLAAAGSWAAALLLALPGGSL